MSNLKVGDKIQTIAWWGENYKFGTVNKTRDHMVYAYWYHKDGAVYYKEYFEDILYKIEDEEVETKAEQKEKAMNIPYNMSETTISVFFNGRIYQVSQEDGRFEPLREFLKSDDQTKEALEMILDRPKYVSRLTAGLVEVGDGEITYDGKPVHGALVDTLLRMLDEGYDVKPWAAFLDRLMMNPSYRSRNQLYGFIEKYQAPITPDGCFIAFKGVTWDYKDHRTRQFDNSIGAVVSMPRSEVDDDPNNTCSSGLHACAAEYLDAGMFSGQRIVVVKINPADVVSIPTDYNFSKMRVCKYTVIDEVKKDNLSDLYATTVYGQ